MQPLPSDGGPESPLPSGVRLFLAVRVDSGTRLGINSEQRHQELDETHLWSPSIHPTRRRGGPHDRPHSSEYPLSLLHKLEAYSFVSPPFWPTWFSAASGNRIYR